MKRTSEIVLATILLTLSASGGDIQFSRFFKDGTLRFDYYHAGTKGEERIMADGMVEEERWAGSLTNLIDTLNLGEYLFTVVEVGTNRVLYSRGYSSMFNEWQTTDQAASGIWRTFHESIRFPFPVRKVQVTIFRRTREMIFREIFATAIDPGSAGIHRERPSGKFTSFDLLENGDPHVKVDLVIVGDGYTADEMPKFRKDAKHFTDVLFSTQPFESRKKDFNVRGVEVTSEESGIDQPDRNIWVRNALGASYSTFGSDRYVLTEENRTLRSVLSGVPYDFVMILFNTKRYGGGGIFQLYTTCYATGETKETAWQADYVFVHEFGHSFAGLGDEYYSSSVAYIDFYAKGVEPWEPNIAENISRKELKWGDLVESTTPLPTLWDKAAYDSLERERGKLKRGEKDYNEKRSALLENEAKILGDQKYANVVGAFEGAGYSATGLYRPTVNCRMFSLSLIGFDPVCSRAISRMVDFYAR